MIIFTGGSYIKVKNEAPKFNDFHKRYYVAGYRWIKTKQTFSTVCVLHNFGHYEVVNMSYPDFMNEHGKYPEKL